MPPKKTPRYKPTAEMKVKKVRVIKNKPDPPRYKPTEEMKVKKVRVIKNRPDAAAAANLKDFGFEELTRINKRFNKHENTRFLYDRLDSWKKEHKKALRDSFTSAATSREKDILARVEKFINVYENSKHKAT